MILKKLKLWQKGSLSPPATMCLWCWVLARVLACGWHPSHCPGWNPWHGGRREGGLGLLESGGWSTNMALWIASEKMSYTVLSRKGCLTCWPCCRRRRCAGVTCAERQQQHFPLRCHKARGMWGFSFRLFKLCTLWGSNSDQQDSSLSPPTASADSALFSNWPIIRFLLASSCFTFAAI